MAGERRARRPFLRAGNEQGGPVDCHAEDDVVLPSGGRVDLTRGRITYRGREGIREALERWLESFADYRYEVQRIVDCGGDDVLVVGFEVRRVAMKAHGLAIGT